MNRQIYRQTDGQKGDYVGIQITTDSKQQKKIVNKYKNDI